MDVDSGVNFLSPEPPLFLRLRFPVTPRSRFCARLAGRGCVDEIPTMTSPGTSNPDKMGGMSLRRSLFPALFSSCFPLVAPKKRRLDSRPPTRCRIRRAFERRLYLHPPSSAFVFPRHAEVSFLCRLGRRGCGDEIPTMTPPETANPDNMGGVSLRRYVLPCAFLLAFSAGCAQEKALRRPTPDPAPNQA